MLRKRIAVWSTNSWQMEPPEAAKRSRSDNLSAYSNSMNSNHPASGSALAESV